MAQEVVSPGTKLSESEGKICGNGVYEARGQIFASSFGVVANQQVKKQGKILNKISVNNVNNPAIVLKLDDVVIGQIFRIKDDGAYVKILQLNNVKVVQHLEGQIKRQHIREKLTDDVKVNDCYLPGDIVKARFISFGDGRRIYLSTAAEDLGVLYAKSQSSGKMMLPYSWTEMICLKSGVREKRKVARPET